MAGISPLEQTVEETLRKYNRITFREKVAHLGRWVALNKGAVFFGTATAALISLGGYLAYDEYFVRSGEIFGYLERTVESLNTLAKSLGEVAVENVSSEKTAAVRNHYVEFLTNLKFAAVQVNETALGELTKSLVAKAGLFTGTSPGEEGLKAINEFRPPIAQLLEKYEPSEGLTWLLPSFVAFLTATLAGVSLAVQKNADEEYEERISAIRETSLRVDCHLPRVFEQLKEDSKKELLYQLAITYIKETGDSEAGIDFLVMAKDASGVIAGDFKGKFGSTKFNYHQNGKNGANIAREGLIEFVEHHLEEFEISGFDRSIVTFDSIGGYEEIKEKLKLYAAIFAEPEEASQQGVEGATGIILEGPPGTGKTLLGEAFIYESLKQFGLQRRKHYKTVTAADLRSMWYSKSEQNIQKLFQRARQKAPYIIFIDEGEELFGKRGRDSHGADTAGTNQLLTEIGGIKRRDRVLTIITSNRAEAIDEAAKRYGRLGIHFRIDIPNEEGRRKIGKIHLERLGRSELLDHFDYEVFAKATDGFTGADIAGIISGTFWERYRAIKIRGAEPYQLTTKHFVDMARTYQQTVRKVGFVQ